jgi:hypothetical protein
MSNQRPASSVHARRHQRAPVSIDIVVAGVLESFDAVIADLSEGGALITGGSLPAKARCEIRYGDQIIYGLVMWSEVDRMGVRFPYELRDGPLHQLLVVARSHHQPRTFAPRAIGGFGRRGLSGR